MTNRSARSQWILAIQLFPHPIDYHHPHRCLVQGFDRARIIIHLVAHNVCISANRVGTGCA